MKYVGIYWLAYAIAMGFYEGWAVTWSGPRPPMTIQEFIHCHFYATLAVGVVAWLLANRPAQIPAPEAQGPSR